MQDKRIALVHRLTAVLVEIKTDFHRGLNPDYDWSEISGSSEDEPMSNPKGILPELRAACLEKKDDTSTLILSIIAPLSSIKGPPEKFDVKIIDQTIDQLRDFSPSKKHFHRKSA